MKICRKCKKDLDETEFNTSSKNKNGFLTICKKCEIIRDLNFASNLKKYRIENKEKYKLYRNTYKSKHKDRIKELAKFTTKKFSLHKNYGISIEDYKIFYDFQGGRCAICGKQSDENGRSLCVDHDHVTGNIRGLLCNSCNYLLGVSKDNIEILDNAIAYLNVNKK